ncbi:hypothetical protein ACFLIP_03655 [Enterobacter hormaechei]|uniref:hypothetical protein n=1 Tax=Enterobacter hormaechei TaxID=158836 RepID=UPI0035FE724D
MSSREQFEAWWEVNYHNGQPPRHGWEFWRDGEGYSIEGDEEFQWRWEAWQAATNAMEAKCAALAAEKEKFAVECAATKIAIAYLKSGRHDFTLNTPATDAFLAEVRAHGVEMFSQFMLRDACGDKESQREIGEVLDAAESFAAQLRQEAAQ